MLFFIVWSLRATVFYGFDRGISDPGLRRVCADVVRAIIWIVPIFFFLRRTEDVPSLELLKLNTSLNIRGLLKSSIIAALYLSVGFIVRLLLAGGKASFSPEFFSHWHNLVLTLPMPALAEELLFRGLILTQGSRLWGFGKANLITALLFAAVHWPFWLSTRGMSLELIQETVSIVGLALVLGYQVKASNSLWPSIITHMVNNLVSWTIIFG